MYAVLSTVLVKPQLSFSTYLGLPDHRARRVFPFHKTWFERYFIRGHRTLLVYRRKTTLWELDREMYGDTRR